MAKNYCQALQRSEVGTELKKAIPLRAYCENKWLRGEHLLQTIDFKGIISEWTVSTLKLDRE